jgi:branched-chain amino acid transport system ATP-binding protein
MSSTQLELKQVAAGYGHTTVTEGISLAVASGERLGVVGRNGAGKTTTLATAMGLTRLRAGSVSFAGRDISSLKPSARAMLGLGYVPQTRDIFPSLTVEENLRAGARHTSRMQVEALLDDAYVLFPRLKERRRNWGNELSGGEQQMLSIARALMGRPTVLLLDEPLEGLAPVIAQELMASIRRLADERGIGCVLVEQQVGLVLDFCTKVLVLERGRGVFYGAPHSLRTEHAHVLDRSIGLRKVAAAAV